MGRQSHEVLMSPASDANRSISPGVNKKGPSKRPQVGNQRGVPTVWPGLARSGGRFLITPSETSRFFSPNRREATSNNQPRLITLLLIIVFKDVILAPPNHNFALLLLLFSIPSGLRERCNCRINDPVMRPCLSTQSRSDILILIVCKKTRKTAEPG